MENISVYKLVSDFNHSDIRKQMIPQGLVSGWPSLKVWGKTLCITIPYFSRIRANDGFYLKSIYCSVTFPIGNPNCLMDFTIYPYQTSWSDVDYTKPVGYFKHEALADIKTKAEYKALCDRLYDYYDKMAAAVLARKPFTEEKEMTELFSKLMEPGLFPQYQRINKKFYTYFCKL